MIRKNQKTMNQLNAISDGCLVLLSYVFSSWLWLDVIRNENNMASLDTLLSHMGFTAVVYAACVVMVMSFFRMYRTSRLAKPTKGLKNVLIANAISLISAAALLYLFRLEEFSRGVLAVFYVTSCSVLIVKRLLLLLFLRTIRSKGLSPCAST